jgi:predicted metalloprotease
MTSRTLALIAAASAAWWFWPALGPHLDRLRPASPQAPHTGSPGGDKFFEMLFGNINGEWRQILPSYRPPRLVLFDGATSAPGECGGRAESRSPFYCPSQGAIYLSPRFRSEIPCSGSSCDFALAAVVAHEVGHHVQSLLGLDPGGRGGPGIELQADCLAGVWAKHEDERLKREGKPPLVEAGDVEAALRMAGQFGDGRSHGTGAQRQQYFSTGWQSGTLASCTGRAGV